jgi:flagellar operon protein
MAGIEGVRGLPGVTPGVADATRHPAGGGDFGLHFSKHAQKRLEQRGIEMDGNRMARLEQAVGQAAAKGSRESLILLDEMALVVSVQNRTVVTAMDQQSGKEQVFTNIDSVVIAP